MAKRFLIVVGARPNFMKAAPVIRALRRAGMGVGLVHTGQHYDAAMSDSFFRDLDLPAPDHHLGVGAASATRQIAEIMQRLEPVLLKEGPAATVVVGDVNSTLAAALASVKSGIPVAHVEAGLRSFDPEMPEELNRILTDRLAEILFTTEPQAGANLIKEGIDPAKIHQVGNVMIDSLRDGLKTAIPAEATRGGRRDEYALLTLHRPATVDSPETLRRVMTVLAEVSARIPIVFPCHPRTRKALDSHGLADLLKGTEIALLEPVGYRGMLGLLKSAKCVLTDSGGLQEETTALGIPCLTLRDNTERPITTEIGTNLLVGTEPAAILSAVDQVLTGRWKSGRVPENWDGSAGERIAGILAKSF
jgi:UDP-N-acetylglucosamine 2-epimerase (non-hydrolysing)